MKRMVSALMGITLLGAAAVGCSSGGDMGKETASGSQDAKDAGQKVTVSLWTLDTGWEWIDQAAEDFKKDNPNIDVQISKYSVDPIKEALKVAANSKTLPDMWFTWGGSLGSFYPENGLTMDLTQIASDHKWSEIYNKAAIDKSTYGGKVSGIPVHLNVLGIWYPKSVYEKAKLKPPATFAEFESQLQTLKDSGVTPLSFGSKGGWHTMRLTEQLLEHFAGPELHDKLSGLTASWNDPAVVKTFEKLKEYTDKGYFPKGYVSLDPTEAEALFYQQKAGLINEGTWFDRNINSNGFDANNYDEFAFPNDHKPARPSVFAEMLQINGKSDKAKQDAAVKLGEYLTSVSVVNKYIEGYGSPATLGVKLSDKTPHLKQLLDSASEGSFLITDQALPQQVVQKLFEAQDKVALGEWTPQQAAVEMDKAVNDYKSKNKQN
ncbi:Multiple sugar-binding protein precursor [Paenibacillus konkukensis]|uniref:Multiple sugar-binding protein n=1 Tax=Paenibacillus konkukensis TaxID=2020716 RepID=A0ABY4RWS6_9BACL|nr:extracellular solute-binding protein [Paenibacillus konkukensis]UQZ86275.1 Multiple sugar-binding protein precursor [Paenibacillus konkukensis]